MERKLRKIGYLVPEFPGQTHNFFWREICALKDLGIEVELYSTRRPPKGIQSTTWGARAAANTVYLYPPRLSEILQIAWLFILSPRRAIDGIIAWRHSIRYLLKHESAFRLFALMLLGMWLGNQIVKSGVKHLHVHSCADAANLALFANKTFGISYSMTLHNPISIWGGNQENKWSNARFGVVIAEWIRKDLAMRFGSYLPRGIHIAPMGVDVAKFQRSTEYIPWNSAAFRVFSCGRLNPAKGFAVLLNAIALAVQSGVDMVLTIAGEDDHGGSGYRKEIEKLIEALKLNERVVLLGSVAEERVKVELEHAHVFVLASLEEPLGVAIMEAMAMEVPVISTDAGGVPDLLANDHGVMVPAGDASALAEAMLKLAASPATAKSLSKQGRALIADRYHHQLSARLIATHVQ